MTELSDGTLVVADADGRVHLLHPDGSRDFFQRSQLFKGPFLEFANGEVLGASRSGEVIVFDSRGQQVRVVAQGDRLDHGPTRLRDGKVVVVDHRGRGFLISPQGELLKEFKVAQDPGRPVALPDGGFAIRGAKEGRLRYFFSAQGSRRKFPPSGAEAFSISWYDPGVLSDGTFVFDDNDPWRPGLVFVTFTEGRVSHWILPIGTMPVQWHATEIAPGRIVVGVNDGELLFIDLEASQGGL